LDGFKRYGFYVVPEGALYRAGADWLGWDSIAGTEVAQPDLPGLPDAPGVLTATPRRYGFHGTIKPPFHLAAGTDAQALDTAARAVCAPRAPVVIPRMEVRRLGGFVAIVPAAPSDDLAAMASAAVAALDPFRAPPSEADLARRRKTGLTERQEALLTRWGYPYVMEEFRFHMTLTGKLAPDAADTTRAVLAAHFAPHLPAPFIVSGLSLMGEDADGRFHHLHRYTFSG